AVAVLFVDLDDFKFVNDSFGHETGDVLLLAVSARLTDAVRPHDLVTRFGGDEFVVVCADVHDPAQAERIAQRLVDALTPAFTIAGRAVGVEALSRWHDTEFGAVSPAVFVALAEEMGVIDRLGRWVLRAACRQFARWRDDLGDLAPAYLSVNLSARQLAGPGLVET